ncbi:BglG family transcription antiterminator [Terribacillus halophilus]|uniref:BglG family transcription antiterminator n=1 Tax=Terribacillus halophilus TaxID=361279 RepID=UPI0009876333|nr:BglG family transcription antiterminator [Terribacillus halophilus]
MLQPRLLEILTFLASESSIKTAEELAKKLAVSERTIRSDMKVLQQELAEELAVIASIRGQGYRLIVANEKLFQQYLQKEIQERQNCLYTRVETPAERVNHLLQLLLLSDSYQKMEDLAQAVFVSFPTVQNDLKQVREMLQKAGLDLEKRPKYGIRIKGTETEKRYFLSAFFSTQSGWQKGYNLPDAIISESDIQAVHNIVHRFVTDKQFALSDVAVQNLVTHIAIACRRIRDKQYVEIAPDALQDMIQQPAFREAAQLTAALEAELHLFFPQVEVAYMTIHLMGTEYGAQGNMQTYMGMSDLAEAIVVRIHDKTGLDLRHDLDLLHGMAVHLKPAIHRHLYDMNVRNPLLEDIKQHYPLAFEAAVIGACAVEEEMGIQLAVEEIGYLALHIGAALERVQQKEQKTKCLLVCASGHGSAQLLRYKLQSLFPDKLDIVDTIEYYRLISTKTWDADVVISTVPIEADVSPLPVIQVPVILDTQAIAKLKAFLKSGQEIRYIQPAYVYLQQEYTCKEDVLAHMAEMLGKDGKVGEGFLHAVYEREKMAPTSFGNLVAVPHPIEAQVEETLWVVCTLKKPIDWSGKPVRFVCLLCIQKDSEEDFTSMYQQLVRIIEHPDHVQRLLEASSYEAFHHTLVSI